MYNVDTNYQRSESNEGKHGVERSVVWNSQKALFVSNETSPFLVSNNFACYVRPFGIQGSASVLVLFGSTGPNCVKITQWFPRNSTDFYSSPPWQMGFQISGPSSWMRKWKCTKSCGASVSLAATLDWLLVSSMFLHFFFMCFAFLPCRWVLQDSSVLLRWTCWFALAQAQVFLLLTAITIPWVLWSGDPSHPVGHLQNAGCKDDSTTPLQQVAAFLGPATRALWSGRPWHDRRSSSWGVACGHDQGRPWQAMSCGLNPMVLFVSGIGWCHQEGDEQCRAVQSGG